MISFKCKRCGQVVTGRDEYEAEGLFDQHKCKGKPDLAKMPTDWLAKIVGGQITEAEAWKIVEKRKG
ncbi:MAG: hypothetical protein M0036_14175 [Desulfobacteraceae bacterium]|nr:hypothetical protein [Desulfobacteraceae bacterium]